MVKWKGINGSIFHFSKICKTFQNYPSLVTPSLFPMFWLDYLEKVTGELLVIFHFAILENQSILQNQVANLENQPIHPPTILQTDVGHLVERVSDQKLNQLYDSFLSIF